MTGFSYWKPTQQTRVREAEHGQLGEYAYFIDSEPCLSEIVMPLTITSLPHRPS